MENKMIIDALKEIVTHTHTLGILDTVKVEGTDEETGFVSLSSDQTVYLHSKFHKAIPEFKGVFGLPDLARLNTILNIPEYSENAQVTMQRHLSDNPASVSFQNVSGDFRNDYRFMSSTIVETQIPTQTLRPIKWDISFTPSARAIQRLKYQSQAVGNTIKSFAAWTDGGNLMVSLGDKSSVVGAFAFAEVTGSVSEANWPLNAIQTILGLDGEKTVKIFSDRLMEIVVDSGFATHTFNIGAVTL